VADGERHGKHGQSEGKSHPQETDAKVRKCGIQNSSATSPEDQPKRPNEFRRRSSA
jgi:hypothetical protein